MMHNILQHINEHKKIEVTQAKQQRPLAWVKEHLQTHDLRDFTAALNAQRLAIIAEIKKASPSKGIIRADFDAANIAQIYEAHGACCLSVLTDKHFFQGHSDYIALAKTYTRLPVLRKDFMIDPYQIYESRMLGADCILLIVALLDDQQLWDYCQMAQELGMSVLVESHTAEELQRALRLPTPLMGINNRNLNTFEIDLNITISLAQCLPKDKILICESGIDTHQDVQQMQAHNIHKFLIGESLMRETDIGQKLQSLLR